MKKLKALLIDYHR